MVPGATTATPRRPMTASAKPDFRIGVDLGGSKIEVIALDHTGGELHRARVPTPRDDAQAVLQAIAGLVRETERMLGGRGSVGVGTPGALSPRTGLLRNSNTVVMNGHPLDRELSDLLDREVRVANDANCFALSEAVDGAGKDGRVVFGVIVGTGTGGGVVVDRQVIVGLHAIAGEWGHTPLPWPQADELPGHACFCGRRGCVETYLAGPSLTRDHEAREGARASAREIAAAASAGDQAAVRSMARYADRMARALAVVIDILDPDVIVIGGGLSRIDALYTEVPARLSRYVFADQVWTPVRRAVHGDSSGVRGAAWLWPAA
jgi:fructokinase